MNRLLAVLQLRDWYEVMYYAADQSFIAASAGGMRNPDVWFWIELMDDAHDFALLERSV